ncbi:MAG: hypothetical protein V9F03_03450 [Microthrixaceae bacterium]
MATSQRNGSTDLYASLNLATGQDFRQEGAPQPLHYRTRSRPLDDESRRRENGRSHQILEVNTPMTDKIDFKKTMDTYHAQRGRFRLVEVPDMGYLMVDGRGDPNTSPAFTEGISALYPVAYKLKFASKRNLGRDYVVPPRVHPGERATNDWQPPRDLPQRLPTSPA